MHLPRFTLLCVLLLLGFAASASDPAVAQATDKQAIDKIAKTDKTERVETPQLKLIPRVRPLQTVRLGGVYTLGLSSNSAPFEESAALGTPLSDENAHWITANCDVIALDAANITPKTFPTMTAAQPLFTPLLYVYASTLYEQPTHHGNVGGWNPQMAGLTLRDAHDKEVPHPDAGGHWMDFGSQDWATHWRDQVIELVQRYGAQGVAAAELPINNTFVPPKLKKYNTMADRAQATSDWLTAARAEGSYLMIPSALGFDTLAGHSTLAPRAEVEEPELRGRLWDDYFPLTDGAWAEGWVRPYWTNAPLSEQNWERQLEAADRAGRLAQVFIAAAAYHNVAELEYALTSYFLVVHRQGRVVFQPMPLVDGQHNDIGYSLTMLRREVLAHPKYFNIILGYPLQERHPVPADGGDVWRRAFQFGLVYVNSSDTRTVTVALGNALKRLDGTKVKRVVLPPHSGVTLVYR